MADDRSISSTSRVDAGDVVRRSFGTVRRGFDPEEVRSYLELLAKALEHADRREQELLGELQSAEERARHPVIDESVLTSSLGQRSAAVLRGAHEEAARILARAEEAAGTMARDAQRQATDAQVNAESAAAERIAEAELEASSLRSQARDDAAAVLETARVEGEVVVERAREQGRTMLDQAQEARRRVLADMAHRRRLVAEQIELLRAARDEIAGSVVGVRRSLDRIVEDLSRADDAARAAASGAAKPHGVEVPEPVLVEEAERALAELGEQGEEGEEQAARPLLRFDDVATVVERREAAAQAAEESAGHAPEPQGEAVHDWQEDPALAGSAPGPTDAPADDVDGLFARLRARHAGVGSEPATTGSTDPGSTDPGATDPGATDLGAADDAADGDPGRVEAEPSPDAAMFVRRAEALDPIVSNLARRLKRALQDDQNGLLDRLRKGTGEWSIDLLVDEESQRALYAKSATASLSDAMAAGMAFARDVAGGRRPKPGAPEQSAVDAVGEELGSTVVTLIRRRLEAGEVPDPAERIGAAYREWRGERIERLAEDRVVEAFSRGVLAASAKRSVRWSRSEVGPGCADCEDNGLAGAVAAGEEFPTGHLHPPAHAGCRCLVLPTPN